MYGKVVEVNKDDFLNKALSDFDNSVVSLKVVPTENELNLKLKLVNRDKLISLNEFGDGISRYIGIICAIWASQNGYLFIDEIENGIHYSNYKKLWNLVFAASEQANCQVFVTSHSKECIEAFNEAQQKRNDDSGCYFELFRSKKTQKIMAAGRDAEQLEYALEHNEGIRGE